MVTDLELIAKGWTPHHRRVTNLDTRPVPGIDHVFSKPGPPRIVLVVDSKYNTAELSTLADGTPQMSYGWITDRLVDAVGKDMADEILLSGFDSVLANVSPDGKITYSLLNEDAEVIGTFVP